MWRFEMKEFDNVIGYEDIKLELYRVVDMLKNPDKYKNLDVKVSLEMERYYWRSKELLIKNRKLLDAVANKLIEKEILLSDGIQKLIMIE